MQVICPICKTSELFLAIQGSKKLLGCGHKIKFKKTRSQKDFDRKYVKTENGYELK